MTKTSLLLDGLQVTTVVLGASQPQVSNPIVLVHGWCVSHRYLMPLAKQLAADHKVHALDLPGFGTSEDPKQVLNMEELADALARWMQVLGLSQAVVLGNSMGGQIAVELALRHPQRVGCLILQGLTVDPGARTWRQQIFRMIPLLWREPLGLLWTVFKDYVRAGWILGYHTFRAALLHPIEERLKQVQLPTLIVCGLRDPISPRAWAERSAELLPQGRLAVLPNAAHAANYDDPEAFAAVVRDFLQGIQRTEPPVSSSETDP